MAPPYEGPNRHEILLLCMKYNFSHHTVDQIHNTNITASDIENVNKLIERKQKASTLEHQSEELIRQLKAISKVRSKGQLGLQDCAQIVAAAEGVVAESGKLLEIARFEKARCEKWAQEMGKQLQHQQPAPKVVKPMSKMEKDRSRERRARADRMAVQAHVDACKLAVEVKDYGTRK
jgi:hypothetical protein